MPWELSTICYCRQFSLTDPVINRGIEHVDSNPELILLDYGPPHFAIAQLYFISFFVIRGGYFAPGIDAGKKDGIVMEHRDRSRVDREPDPVVWIYV